MSSNPATCLPAQSSTSGEPQGLSYNMGFGLAGSTEGDPDIWKAEHIPFYQVSQIGLESVLAFTVSLFDGPLLGDPPIPNSSPISEPGGTTTKQLLGLGHALAFLVAIL